MVVNPPKPSYDYGAIAAQLPKVATTEYYRAELYNLTDSVEDNVSIIDDGLKSLEKMMKEIGGPNDTVELREKIQETQQNVDLSMLATAYDIQRMSTVFDRAGEIKKLLAK